MKKIICITSILICLLLTACGNNGITKNSSTDRSTNIESNEQGEKMMFEQITAEDAKKIMDSGEDCIILDVREQDEYNEGHISGAILNPYTEIENKADEKLPDKDKLILVYCRSGRRSKIAAQSLADLGYTNIKEFGGIIDWPYEIER